MANKFGVNSCTNMPYPKTMGVPEQELSGDLLLDRNPEPFHSVGAVQRLKNLIVFVKLLLVYNLKKAYKWLDHL